MKKFLVVLVVLTLVGLASIALAADVTVGGSVQIRSRDFQNMTFDKSSTATGATTVDTQERIIIDVNAKAGDNLKGKISLWNDFEDWGNFENVQGQGFGNSTGATKTAPHFGFREAWVSFNLPDIPVNVTGGHQLLKLANGWFFRSQHFGSDAWVVANVTGGNTLAFLDVKLAEGLAAASDDADAYVLLDAFKLSDAMTIGIDLSDVRFRANNPITVGLLGTRPVEVQNYDIFFNGKLGPVNLQANIEAQGGKVSALGAAQEIKFKGNEIVIQGNIPIDALTINFLLARGSGQKWNDMDHKEYINFLDIDPHYTFLYEYKLRTAAILPSGSGGFANSAHTGFANTTAASVGAMFHASKSLDLGLDFYWLQATEKDGSPLAVATAGAQSSSDIGWEADAKVYWKIYDNLTWNWDLGYFKPGDGMKQSTTAKTDAAMGVQGVLAFKF